MAFKSFVRNYLIAHHHQIGLTELQCLVSKHRVGSTTLHANLHLISIFGRGKIDSSQLSRAYAFGNDRFFCSWLKGQRIDIAHGLLLNVDKSRQIDVACLYAFIVIGETHMQVFTTLGGSEMHTLAIGLVVIAGICERLVYNLNGVFSVSTVTNPSSLTIKIAFGIVEVFSKAHLCRKL